MEDMETEFFECACHSDEHVLRITLDPVNDGDGPSVYTSVFLNQYRGFFKRCWVAIKYVFGYKSKFGHWDSFLMREKDADRFVELAIRLQKLVKEFQKTNDQ